MLFYMMVFYSISSYKCHLLFSKSGNAPEAPVIKRKINQSHNALLQPVHQSTKASLLIFLRLSVQLWNRAV
jgi:hypothetical protein